MGGLIAWDGLAMRARANAGKLCRMGMLPKLSGSDLVRTDFTDDSAWEQVSSEAQQETADGFRAYVEVVSDPAFDGLSWEAVKAAVPADDDEGAVLFIADSATFASGGHPILVVDLLEDRPPFRCIPSQLWSVENNLSIANMDWEEFADAADDAGIFRGFPE
jgi:hypothetical protein